MKYPQSKHNKHPSRAVDATPLEKGQGIDQKPRQMAFFAGFVKGIAAKLYSLRIMDHRIKLGIDWDSDEDIDDEKFIDSGYFELIPNERDI